MLLLEEATHHMGVDMAWNNTHVHQTELLGNTPIGRSCVANVWDGPNSSLLVIFFPNPNPNPNQYLANHFIAKK
jgi:hypothetical protein